MPSNSDPDPHQLLPLHAGHGAGVRGGINFKHPDRADGADDREQASNRNRESADGLSWCVRLPNSAAIGVHRAAPAADYLGGTRRRGQMPSSSCRNTLSQRRARSAQRKCCPSRRPAPAPQQQFPDCVAERSRRTSRFPSVSCPSLFCSSKLSICAVPVLPEKSMFCSFTRPEVVPSGSLTTPYIPSVTCWTVSSESGKDSAFRPVASFSKVRRDQACRRWRRPRSCERAGSA